MTKMTNNKGVTLVEVMVSILIISTVVAAVLTVVTKTIINAAQVDMVYTASNLAKKKVDDLKRMSFRDLKNFAEETNVRINAKGDTDTQGDYFRSIEVTENQYSNPYLTKVKVSVDRVVNGSPKGNPVVIETLFADVE